MYNVKVKRNVKVCSYLGKWPELRAPANNTVRESSDNKKERETSYDHFKPCSIMTDFL